MPVTADLLSMPDPLERARLCDLALWEWPRVLPLAELVAVRRHALSDAVDDGVTTEQAALALHVLPADVARILHP